MIRQMVGVIKLLSPQGHPRWQGANLGVGRPDGLGGLQRVVQLRQTDVRIGVINDLVQQLRRLPDAQLHGAERAKSGGLLLCECMRLRIATILSTQKDDLQWST